MSLAEAAVEVESAADDIASKIIGILVRSFSDRHQRQPSDEEMQSLLAELTQDRIAELMGESEAEVRGDASTSTAEEEEKGLSDSAGSDDESDDQGPTEKRLRSL